MSVTILSRTMKVTKKELLERIIELEKKMKKMLDSCSYVKASLEEKGLRESEDYSQLLTEPITKKIMPEPRCNCEGGDRNYHLYGCNSFPKDK